MMLLILPTLLLLLLLLRLECQATLDLHAAYIPLAVPQPAQKCVGACACMHVYWLLINKWLHTKQVGISTI